MNKKIVICAMLSMAIVIPVLSPVTEASLEKPKWEKGDYWEYRVEIYSGAIVANNVTSHEEIMGEKNVTVNGTSYDAIFVKVTPSKNYSAGYQYYRSSDLAVIKLEFTAINASIIYEPPYATWKYPVEVGNTWEYHGDIITQSPQGSKIDHINLSYECTGEENITVPAGEFHCYVIKQSSGDGKNYAVHYLSPHAGNEVEVDNYYNKELFNKKVLLSFSYMGNTTVNVTENNNSAGNTSGNGKTPDFGVMSAVFGISAVLFLIRKKSR